MTRLSLALVLLSAAACSSPSRFVRIGAVLPAKERECELRVYGEGERPRNAVVLGRVEAEGRRRAFVDAELRSQACALGADAMVAVEVDEFTATRASYDDNRDVKIVEEGEIYAGTALAMFVRDPTPIRRAAPLAAAEPISAPAPSLPCPSIPEPPVAASAPVAPPVPAPEPARPPPTRTSPEPELLDTMPPPPPLDVDAR